MCGDGRRCWFPLDLDDDDPCTTDRCDVVTGVVHEPVDVDDGDPCTLDTCDPVLGVMRGPADVDDGDACTIDTCEALTGFGVQDRSGDARAAPRDRRRRRLHRGRMQSVHGGRAAYGHFWLLL